MATTRMERVRHTAGCCHTSKLVDSRIAEPSGSCEQLPGGSCRCGQSRLARSRLGGLLVEARTKQLVLCLLVPVPVVPPCSFTHNALLENENGWRSAGTANRVCDCGGVLLRKKRRAVCCHASRVRESLSLVDIWEDKSVLGTRQRHVAGHSSGNPVLNARSLDTTPSPAVMRVRRRGLENLPWQ